MILEVGTVLYAEDRYSGMRKYVVSRVTPKIAFVRVNERSEIKFDREIKDGTWIRSKGSSPSWDRPVYKLQNAELDQKYMLYTLRRLFRKIDADELGEDQLKNILEIAGIRGEL